MNYKEFLQTKQYRISNQGKEIERGLIHSKLFDWQKDIAQWAIRKGRCAVFLDTGLGKTFIQLEWARILGENTLIIAPLSVAMQTVREAIKLDLDIKYVRSQPDSNGIWITNYEMVDNFDFSRFGAVVLDESSILKSIGGHTRKKLTDLCSNVKYRLCCTATPAPNDFIEIGNHTEFLGICKRSEMLATFFVNANKEHTLRALSGETYRRKGSNANGTEWRLKHHAENPFFKWLSTWAITMTKPSDLGYDDDGFILPPLSITPIFVSGEYHPADQLFFTHLRGITDRVEIRQATLAAKIEKLKEIVDVSKGQWLIWCGLDTESKEATNILNATEIKGSDNIEYKVETLEKFQEGDIPILVTKPKIAGFGMNFQSSHNMVFLGLNDSWETYYQCIRRQWRYMQTEQVNVYIIMHEAEMEVYSNVLRKDAQANRLKEKLIKEIKVYEKEELGMKAELRTDYTENTVKGNNWTAMLGDSCERLKEIPDSSIDLSVYSPPFADLFTYTSSERDLGNCRDWQEFFGHYKFIIREILRVTKQGRLTCVHTSDIPALAQKDGYIGIKDFPGAVIKAYESEGWIFHGRCFVQKNPQAQAIRTHGKSLLFVQLRKDSSDSRPALIDQILIFKKEGQAEVPVTPVKNGEMNNEKWIEWAHGIWTGIRETDTLQFASARGNDDEKHICPLQLGTIERCIKLYSNPNETILTPFGGIGSEAYMALKLGRKAILIELKPEYFEVAVKNLKQAESQKQDLFSYKS